MLLCRLQDGLGVDVEELLGLLEDGVESCGLTVQQGEGEEEEETEKSGLNVFHR